MKPLALFLATSAYVGYFPIAPGTAGSLAGLVLYAGLRWLGLPWLELAAIALVYAAGIWAGGVAEQHFNRVDPGPVVIDEVLGMLITLAFIPVGLTGAWIGFVVFRVLDVFKPWPAGRLESLHGGLGIMSDDAMAAVYGNAIMRLLAWAAPQWVLG